MKDEKITKFTNNIENRLHFLHEKFCNYLSSNPSIEEAGEYLEKTISEYFKLENGNIKHVVKPFWWVYITPNYTPGIGNGGTKLNHIHFDRKKTENEFSKYKHEIVKRIISSIEISAYQL